MLELEIDIELEGILNLEVEIENTEIIIKEGFDQFDINLVNPTLAAGELVVPFSFNPSPQEDVTSVELWVNGAMIEIRLGNSEAPFTASGIVGAATVQIRAYNNGNLMQQSAVYQLPIPNAADFDDFTFGSSKIIDVIAECSDPQSLPIEIKYLGVPTNGQVSLIDTDFISVQEIDRNNPTLIPYVIENSAGVTDNGLITFHWESIALSITSPTENQQIPNDEGITVSFTVTPATQNYISAIALVVDGVEVEKRTPYSTDDFTIAAGELSVDSHNIMLRAYDSNDEVVYNSQAVSVDVVASFVGLLDLYPGAILARDFFKLSSTYNGNCIRVFRQSDSQEFEIGFATDYIGKPYLDVNYLLSLYNGSAIYGVTTYDQSGNGNDLYATSESTMPMIVDATGNLVSEGLFAMLDFDGVNDFLQTETGLNFGTSSRSVFTLQNCATTTALTRILNLTDRDSSSASGSGWIITNEVAVRAQSVTWESNSGLTNQMSLISNIYTNGTIFEGNKMWINGVEVNRGSGTDGTINTSDFPVIEGAISPTNIGDPMKKATTIIYKSDQTANRASIENIIMSNYGMV